VRANGVARPFWKFANSLSETDDGEEHTASSSRLLFTRGYSIFNAAQVDGYTPKADRDAPIEQRIESAEQFFSRMNARVAHQGNRAFYSPADDSITLPPFAGRTRRGFVGPKQVAHTGDIAIGRRALPRIV
jgi:antirestriction protein ArdC